MFHNFQAKDILTKCCAERSVNWLQTVIIVKRALLVSLVVSKIEGKNENDLHYNISLSTCTEAENMS